MMTQTSYQTRRGLKRLSREDIPTTERHPLVLCSWATKPPNVGSIQRLAEAFLVEEFYSCHHPAKASAVGTGRWQPTTITWSLNEVASLTKMAGFAVVALEQTTESVKMEDVVLPERMCLLVGNESSGLPQSALDLADMAVEITQYGVVGSLNVATATAICLYEWSRQHGKKEAA